MIMWGGIQKKIKPEAVPPGLSFWPAKSVTWQMEFT